MNIWDNSEDTLSLSANNQCIFKIIPFCLYLFLRLFFFNCVSEEGQDYMHIRAGAGGSQERVLDSSQLELDVIVSQGHRC